MKCEKIVAYITRTSDDDKIKKSIVAFNQRYWLVSVSGNSWNEAKAIYEPEDKLLEDRYK
jgi:hypothetical protein